MTLTTPPTPATPASRMTRLSRIARPALMMLAAGLAATLGLLPAPAGAGTTDDSTDVSTALRTAALAAGGTSSRVTLELGAISPSSLAMGDTVVIRGTVRNGTAKRLTKARVAVTVHERLTSRAGVQDWVGGETESTADRQVTDIRLARTAAGGSNSFLMRIPVEDFGLVSWSSDGPRGITISVVNGERTMAQQRTTIVWWPTETTTAARLTLLAPVTASVPGTDAGAPTVDAEADLRSGGRLDRVLDAASDPAFGWAVDPSVLAAAAALRDGAQVTGTATPTASGSGSSTSSPGGADSSASGAAASATPEASGSTSASAAGSAGTTDPADQAMAAGRQWLTKVGQRLKGRSLLGLPYGDPDLNSVLNNKAGSLLTMTQDLGRRVTLATVGQGFDTTVAWPGDGRTATRSVSAIAKAYGPDASILLASATQPVEAAAAGATSTGRSTLTGGGQSVQGLLYDEELSTLLSGSGGTGSAFASQTMLAELAAISMTSPSEPLHLLAVTPRTWSPDPLKVQALTSTLASVPYVQLDSLPELKNQKAVAGRADPTYGAAAKATELPPSAVQRALALKRKLDVFGPAVANPDAVLDPYRERVASLLSVGWRRDRDDLAVAGTEIDRRVGELVDGVHLQVGSEGKLFTARSAPIQLAVRNDTPNDLRLRVELKPKVLVPGSSSLEMESKEIVAKANQQTKVLIPTRASGSGDVEVTATLKNLSGGIIEESSQFNVKVRPDWETRGMIGAASLLGLLLIIGLLRGVRRNRTRVPAESVPDVDDIAVRLAEERLGPPTGPMRKPATTTSDQPDPPATVAHVQVGADSGDHG